MITFKTYFLLEGIKTPSELKQEQIYFIINHQNDTRIQINMYKRPQKFMFSGQLMKYNNLWVFHIQSKQNKLGNVYAHKGYGPVMYDIAMELASKYGEGLVTPISIGEGYPSDESINVYKYYYNKRSDIQKTPFDLEKYGFKESDLYRSYYDDDDDGMITLSGEPQPWLTTLYVKSNPTTLNQLEANNMIRYTDLDQAQYPLVKPHLKELPKIEQRIKTKNYLISSFVRIYKISEKNAERLYNDLFKSKIIVLKRNGIPELIDPLLKRQIIPHDVEKYVNISNYK